MKKNLCWIVICLDRSGSMIDIRDDMIGGFNTFIKEQKEANIIGECKLFAYKFDTEYETMFENIDINTYPVLDRNSYIPRGSTALYDSLGKTIVNIGQRLTNLPEEERPEKVLFITITDGQDNAGLIDNYDNIITHYTVDEIKEMVKHQTEKYNWSFAYLGANQDAWAVGASMGYQSGTTLDYLADEEGTAQAYQLLSRSVKYYRSNEAIRSFSFNDNNTVDKIK